MTTQKWFEDGNSWLEKGDYSKAIECYDKAIKLDNDYAFAYRNKGLALYDFGMYEKAIDSYQSYLDLLENTNDANIIVEKCNILYEISLTHFALFRQKADKSHLENAITFCLKTLAICFEKIYIEKTMGLMRYQKEATEEYLFYVKHLSVLYQYSGELDKSEELLKISRNLYFRYRDWKQLGITYEEIGNLYTKRGRIEFVMYYYTRALQIKKRIGNRQGAEITLSNIAACMKENPGIMIEENSSMLVKLALEEIV